MRRKSTYFWLGIFITGFIILDWACEIEGQSLTYTISGERLGNHLGGAVATSADGNRIAIGVAYNSNLNGRNAGCVRVFDYIKGWRRIGPDVTGDAAEDHAGTAVALSADGLRLAVGAPHHDAYGVAAGQVKVYAYDGTAWKPLGEAIIGAAAFDELGSAVALSADGSRLAIGAPKNDSNGTNAGLARAYAYDGTAWTPLGEPILGAAAFDGLGSAVALSADGNYLAIGAPENDDNGESAGHVRIYAYNGAMWEQLGKAIEGEAANDYSGQSIALSADGRRIAIGATGNADNGTWSGHVRIYTYNGTSWIQVGQDLDGAAADDNSGIAVALSADGRRIAIGATGNDNNGASAGHVRLYDFDGVRWQQVASDFDGYAANACAGQSVALSAKGARLVIGAPCSNDYSGQVYIHDYPRHKP